MAGKVASKKKIEGLRIRMLDGKPVIPVLYNGRHVGHGKFFAGQVDDKLICDEDGKPIPFKEIGELV